MFAARHLIFTPLAHTHRYISASRAEQGENHRLAQGRLPELLGELAAAQADSGDWFARWQGAP
jgi:hypothetical protein